MKDQRDDELPLYENCLHFQLLHRFMLWKTDSGHWAAAVITGLDAPIDLLIMNNIKSVGNKFWLLSSFEKKSEHVNQFF